MNLRENLKENVNNSKLQTALKQLWEGNRLPIVLSKDLDGDGGSTIKVGVSVFNQFDWVKTPEAIAYELTEALMTFLVKHLGFNNKVTITQTLENLVAPFIMGAEDIANESDKCVTAYYSGNTDLNPPIIKAWLVIRVTSPTLKESEYVIDIDAEKAMAA